MDRLYIHGPHLTARAAMEAYAREAFDEPRKIGLAMRCPTGEQFAMQFKLVNGTRWYRVTVDARKQGWNVAPLVEAGTA